MPKATVEHGADLYHKDNKVLPTCQCGWEGTWLPTYDEAADAYALHRKQDRPYLGLATTRELLEEIKARGEVSHAIGEYPEEMGAMAIGAANLLATLPGSMLDYSTWRR